MYPPIRSLIFGAACLVAALLAVAGCGGGSNAKSSPPQGIRGTGFVFKAPAKWHVSRTQERVAASPNPVANELVSVSVFPLLRTYTPALYEREVTKELDPYSKQLARQQNGKVVGAKDVQVAGIKSRQYQIEYERSGAKLAEQITFVFRNKTEYELLCQWDASKSEPSYCPLLATSFRPV